MKWILIADDSPLILTQLADTLVSIGYEVAGKASSGKGAVEQARIMRPDIVLLDIIMPGEMDGIEAARRIVEILDIPVVFLTGHEDEKLIERAKDVGASGYLLKPVNPGELKATIEIVLQKKESERESKDLYWSLVENTNDFIYILDIQGNFRYCNTTFRDMLVHRDKVIVGRSIIDFVVPESYEHGAEIFRRQLKGEDVGAFEVKLYDKNRNIRIVEARERFVRKDGRADEIHGIGRDVTERRRIEQALKQSEEEFRLAFENASIGMCLVDLSGRLIRVNNQMSKIFGYEKEELERMTVNDIAHPDDLELSPSFIRRASLGEVEQSEFEKRYFHKQGRIVYGQVTSSLVRDNSGQPLYFISHVKDITEPKRADEEREKLILELRDALSKIRTLSGLLPICASCKKIRDDKGYWNQLEEFISEHSDAILTHSYCPDCAKKAVKDYQAKKTGK